MRRYCNHCRKKTEFISQGFPGYNEREECEECESVYVHLSSRLFGKYRGYPKFVDKKDWMVILNE